MLYTYFSHLVFYSSKIKSHWGSKTHSCDVYGLVASLLTNEAIDNLSTDPRLAYDIAKAAITSLTDNFHTMQRPGYDDMGDLGTIDSSLRTIAEKHLGELITTSASKPRGSR